MLDTLVSYMLHVVKFSMCSDIQGGMILIICIFVGLFWVQIHLCICYCS
jgi:hypothetical protein